MYGYSDKIMYTIPKRDIESFKLFLQKELVVFRGAKSPIEALQVRLQKKWAVIYKRRDMPFHFVFYNETLARLVRLFNESKEKAL